MTGTTTIGIRLDLTQKQLMQERAQRMGLPLATYLYQLIQTAGGLPPKTDGRRRPEGWVPPERPHKPKMVKRWVDGQFIQVPAEEANSG